MKLVNFSPELKKLDDYWREHSTSCTSYKIFFYATLDQIHKFTFDIKENTNPYTGIELLESHDRALKGHKIASA